MSGLFISFEGGDGSGKSTQVKRLAAWLTNQGYSVVVTREPGGTELGEHIRHLLLHGGDVSPRAEALLYAADRAHHMETKILPALKRGEIVITDRFLDSSVAYQGAARLLGKQEVRDLSLWAVNHLMPAVTFLLDVPVEIGRERVGAEKDRLEAAGMEFHQRVREEFCQLAKDDPRRWHTIDATADIAHIEQEIRTVVADLLKNVEAGTLTRSMVDVAGSLGL
ncbi:dTMP kinase [Arcanobacterium pinnipediorum]|uniref:Thymidylate kinase n=1 Tax=Arcanobacterium pinnipediorum TaxID=1503041 RepID=A0ABY5AJ88_9ACTO|nr:dTMP kinase [Arcanobacterium pinnipediorum]USR79304.1 dTMP kinase [Arcanobacterium pinnipediorum]